MADPVVGARGDRPPLLPLFLDQTEVRRTKNFPFMSVLPFTGTILREFPHQKKTGRIKHSIKMVFDTHTPVQQKNFKKNIFTGEGAQQ